MVYQGHPEFSELFLSMNDQFRRRTSNHIENMLRHLENIGCYLVTQSGERH
jgi:hypothetical protein